MPRARYSPLWDVTPVAPVAWAQAAIDASDRVRLGSHETVERVFDQGLLVNANPDGPARTTRIPGVRALGVVVGCPPMFVAPAGPLEGEVHSTTPICVTQARTGSAPHPRVRAAAAQHLVVAASVRLVVARGPSSRGRRTS